MRGAALASVRPKLALLERTVGPSTDPCSAALLALVVADRMSRADVQARLRDLAGSFDPRSIDDLRLAARAVRELVDQLGGVWIDPRTKEISSSLRSEADALRTSMMAVVERSLDDADARTWLEVIREGSGDLDLLLDLRSLADLYDEYSDELMAEGIKSTEQNARRLADTIEEELVRGDGCEVVRRDLAQVWTLLVPLYEEVCRAGRFLLRDKKGFPPLATIARIRRRTRRSRARPPSLPARPTLPGDGLSPVAPIDGAGEERPTEGAVAAMPAATPAPLVLSTISLAPPVVITVAATEDAVGAPLLIEPTDTLPTKPPGPLSFAPAPPREEPLVPAAMDEPRQSSVPPPAPRVSRWSRHHEETRQGTRYGVDIEVGIGTDSNFYVGFTENVSEGGLFVATYDVLPIGTKLALRLTMPGVASPVEIHGKVCWVRQPSEDTELWPGMGVRFENVSSAIEKSIRRFLETREPLFFDE